MQLLKQFLLHVVLLTYTGLIYSQKSFESAFENCHRNDSEFDKCILNALNEVRPYFKTGVPEWNLPPFDPFFAPEVVQNVGKSALNYKLTLINATEAGWTQSEVIRFRSNFDNNQIRYTQYFPAKFLKGMYNFRANILGNHLSRMGKWDLALYGFVQSTTITRYPGLLENETVTYNTPLKVVINIHSTENMVLHISNLLGGDKVLLEILLDKLINFAWPPGFAVLKPFINDLVGTAFTDIFNMAFKDFPFDKLIH